MYCDKDKTGQMSKEVIEMRGDFAYGGDSRYKKIKHIWDMFSRQNQQDLPTDSLDLGYEEERRD